MINDQEEKDKKEKEMFRGKERLAGEEKNKLLRKIDALEKDLAGKKEEKELLETQIIEV